MLKVIKILFFITIVIAVGAIIITVKNSYIAHSSASTENPNAFITTVNYAVQIGFNIVYLILAAVVLAVAYFQLDKTVKATTIQTLIQLDTYIRSDEFLIKRKKVGEIVLANELVNMRSWVERFNPESNSIKKEKGEIEDLAFVKNIFESVIYEFELIGHFYKSHIFSIEDVYQLFSIEVQNYWVLMSEIGYIKYLRENESEDFYDKFENLFIDTLKQEIINGSPFFLKYFFKIYYWTGLYKMFYKGEIYRLLETKNKLATLSENIKERIPLFLEEEENLI